RTAGGAGGVQLEDRITRLLALLWLEGAGRIAECRVITVAGTDDGGAPEARCCRMLVLGESEAQLGVSGDVANLGGHRERTDRDDGRPDQRGSERQLEDLRRIGLEDPDTVTAANSFS